MADFEIGGVAYQSRLLNGEEQINVLRILLPTVTALVGTASAMEGDEADAEERAATDPKAAFSAALMPVARELAALSPADVKFVLDACLQVTNRRVAVGTGWVPVIQRDHIQDANDAKFMTRLTIAWHVLGENFGEMLTSFGIDVGRLVSGAPKAAAG